MLLLFFAVIFAVHRHIKIKNPSRWCKGFRIFKISLVLELSNQAFCQIYHFLYSFFRQISFLKFRQDIWILVFHFQQELFFKFLHSSNRYFPDQTLCTEVNYGHLLLHRYKASIAAALGFPRYAHLCRLPVW